MISTLRVCSTVLDIHGESETKDLVTVLRKLPTYLGKLKLHSHRHGLPCGLAGKESTCTVGDPSLIPGSGRATGGGIGYPLQYSRASLVAQLVKNPPAMWETWV